MDIALKETQNKLPAPPWGHLPPQMRMLFVTGHHRTGAWLAEAFASDSASEVELFEVDSMSSGLARLRDEMFDAVLISHEPGELDALELLEALRTGSSDEQPVIVLGNQSEQEMAALCFEVGADAYICVNTTTIRTLIWQVSRAMERHRLISENRRLMHSRRHQLQLEHDEADRLLQQQKVLIADLDKVHDEGRCEESFAGENHQRVTPVIEESLALPEVLINHYRELLRTYVIMGAGNLSAEMHSLGDLLASAGVSAQQAMLLHLRVLEEMIRDLGNRSARHVMNRADILVLEVMIHLADGYREQFFDRLYPPRQLTLPGFEDAPVAAFGK